MIKLYEDLLRIKSDLPDDQFRSTFVCMRPKEESKIRLMLIGRATNGWGDRETDSEYLPRKRDEFSKRAQELFEDPNRWGWIPQDYKITYQEDGIEKIYNINRSPFWNYTRDIHAKLTQSSSERWFESIAWSNLYKVSPSKGNPSAKSLRLQKDICSKILDYEIDVIKPTHILFETGYNWVFENITINGEKRVNGHVEWIGTYKDAKCIISCRPEFREKTNFVNDIVEAFESI